MIAICVCVAAVRTMAKEGSSPQNCLRNDRGPIRGVCIGKITKAICLYCSEHARRSGAVPALGTFFALFFGHWTVDYGSFDMIYRICTIITHTFKCKPQIGVQASNLSVGEGVGLRFVCALQSGSKAKSESSCFFFFNSPHVKLPALYNQGRARIAQIRYIRLAV